MSAVNSSFSLEEAVKDKYCDSGDDGDAQTSPAHKSIKETAMSYRPGAYPVQRRSSIVLDHQGITHVDSCEELGSLCPQVEEMILGGNSITQWRDVCGIMSTLPKLSLLDLSQNPLEQDSMSSTQPPPPSPSLSPSLSILVLNCTSVMWDAVQTCLEMVPSLQELHLTRNGYSTVSLDPSFHHESLNRLHINENELCDWSEIEKLSSAFPNLKILVAAQNPLSDIPPMRDCHFPQLSVLNLNSTAIEKWSSVENLASLEKLSEVCLMKVPVGMKLKEKERRFAIIARFPQLKKLNKSTISDTEREDSERWLIRTHMHDRNPPSIYSSLVKKHGSLDPLAEVDMRPKKVANIEFCFEERRSEIHRIQLNQTTSQLRKWVAKLIGKPSNTFRLLYMDPFMVECDSHYPGELMRQSSKHLYSYDMKDGNQIRVQMLV